MIAMKRLSYHGHLAWLCGLGLFACGGDPPGPEENDLVVILIVDTLRQDALGCYGRENARTPRIDALAAGGTRFDQAISSSGWTLPSVASLLTGTWPAMHKATGKSTLLTPITGDLPVAAEVFGQAGFTTIGLANAAFLSPLLGLDRGFDVFDHRHAYNREIRRADETFDTALGEIAAHSGEKIFALVHVFDVHLDYDPPQGFIEPFVNGRSDPPPPLSMFQCIEMGRKGLGPLPADKRYMRGLYQGEVAFVDRAVGRFIDGLKELGRWSDTTLLLISDHGEEFWDHGGFEHGHTLFDELIRVPLIMHLPGGEARPGQSIAQSIIDTQVRSVDVMPTLFDMYNIEAPGSFVGESLLPLIAGKSRPAPPAFSQSTLYGADKLSWRVDPYQLIYDLAPDADPKYELYNFRTDPETIKDLALELPEVGENLHRDLARFYNDLKARAKGIRVPEVKNMSPSDVSKYLESIKVLGYSGREEDE